MSRNNPEQHATHHDRKKIYSSGSPGKGDSKADGLEGLSSQQDEPGLDMSQIPDLGR